jgi:hypothetical protein
MVQMDSMVCGVDALQIAEIVNADEEVTAAFDAVMDCTEVSVCGDPSTESVEVKDNAGQCLFCDDVEFLHVADCQKCYKRKLK